MTRSQFLSLCVMLAGVLALTVAMSAQYFEGLSPCALCLIERWPYRIAFLAGLLALNLPPRYARWVLWFALACFVADLAVACVHVGVEIGWWKSPLPECSGPNLSGLSGSALLAALPAKPITPCDSPVYMLHWLKFSMASMNLVYAAGTSLLLGWMMTRKKLA